MSHVNIDTKIISVSCYTCLNKISRDVFIFYKTKQIFKRIIEKKTHMCQEYIYIIKQIFSVTTAKPTPKATTMPSGKLIITISNKD